MKKCSKIKDTCGTRIVAECVDYEATINSNSVLVETDCLTISETTQDIYTQLEQINLSTLGESCLTYVEIGGKLIVKNVLLKMEEEICSLKSEIEILKNNPLCSQKINSCINVTGMVDACDSPVETWGQWAQLITNKYLVP
jgi:hypothetical protein